MRARPGNFTATDRAKVFLSHQTYKGLIMTIRSFKEATKYLLDNGIDFVLSNKFCQDPLEARFGMYRGFVHLWLPRKQDTTTKKFCHDIATKRKHREEKEGK